MHGMPKIPSPSITFASYRQPGPVRNPFDVVGLVLLVIWVAALQLVLDEGKNRDWFASHEIVVMSIVAALSFAMFLIWELHEKHPIVDLRVFRHRGFNAAVSVLPITRGLSHTDIRIA